MLQFFSVIPTFHSARREDNRCIHVDGHHKAVGLLANESALALPLVSQPALLHSTQPLLSVQPSLPYDRYLSSSLFLVVIAVVSFIPMIPPPLFFFLFLYWTASHRSVCFCPSPSINMAGNIDLCFLTALPFIIFRIESLTVLGTCSETKPFFINTLLLGKCYWITSNLFLCFIFNSLF